MGLNKKYKLLSFRFALYRGKAGKYIKEHENEFSTGFRWVVNPEDKFLVELIDSVDVKTLYYSEEFMKKFKYRCRCLKLNK